MTGFMAPVVHQTFITPLGSKYSNGKKVSTSICAILEEVKLLLKLDMPLQTTLHMPLQKIPHLHYC